MQPQTTQADRRRRDLAGRVLRATYPARQALSRSEHPVGAFLCSTLGHRRPVAVPFSFRSRHARDRGLTEWQCPRCGLRLGGTTGVEARSR